MRAFFSLLAISFCCNAWAGDEGQLRLFRWAPGLKAENIPALEALLDTRAYREVMRDPTAFAAAHAQKIFPGCYLAIFEPTATKQEGRGLANAGDIDETAAVGAARVSVLSAAETSESVSAFKTPKPPGPEMRKFCFSR